MLTFVKISTDMIILQILPLKNVYNNINCSHLYNAISLKKKRPFKLIKLHIPV